jgi:nicotinamide-nucleotide amidase
MTGKALLASLREKGLTIAFAESISGGSLSFELVKNPGSSIVLIGSVVAYHKDSKIKLLKVPKEIIDTYGIVSQEVATTMAINIQKLTCAKVGVATTGNAGPSLQSGYLQKTAWIAIAYQNQVQSYQLIFDEETRIQAIKKVISFTCQKVIETIQ